jgi:hypothetical protein
MSCEKLEIIIDRGITRIRGNCARNFKILVPEVVVVVVVVVIVLITPHPKAVPKKNAITIKKKEMESETFLLHFHQQPFGV